jgi:hypothetical protein
MYTLKYGSQIFECVSVEQKKYTLLDIELEKLSQVYNIGFIYLKKLCDDMNLKTQYSYSDAVSIIENELANGLDINKIILKYNLDKDLV